VIVELRTYLLKPGSAQEVEELFKNHLHHRMPASPLAGLWHTTSGVLNRILHLWPYDTIEQRMQVRKDMWKPPDWPPPLRPFLVEMEAEVWLPAPFSPGLAPAQHGGLYEFCIDSFLPSGLDHYVRDWTEKLPARIALSPLVFCGVSELGVLNRLLHVWAYRDSAHRDEVHRALAASSSWPPASGRDKLVRQESILTAPAECSPLN
jgi:hypothetical protein